MPGSARENIRFEMLDMQIDVVLLLADAASLANLDCLARYTSREDRSFSCGALSGMNLRLAVGHNRLRAGTLGDQNPHAIHTGSGGTE